MKRIRLSTQIILAIILSAAVLCADATDLASSINAQLSSPALKHGIQGVVVESLATGRVLYERNRDTVFIPASNFKLIVSAAILDRLGPDYTFSTRVYRTGEIRSDGILNGDVVLLGGGDPTLTTSDLKNLAQQVAQSGIRGITGAVVGDDTRFDDVRLGEGWAWSDEPYYYSAEISALNLNENTVGVYVSPGEKVGDPARIRLEPPTAYLRTETTALTGASDSKDTIEVDRVHGRNQVRVKGSIPLGKKITGPAELITVVDPALYAATVFVEQLKSAGVSVIGRPITYKKPDGAVLIAERRSAPLGEILPQMLKPSDNLIAEVFLKTLGAETSPPGTAASGAKAEMEFLKKAGLDLSAISIVDGSGLSRRDYVSPGNLVSLLKYMWHHKWSKVYYDSLPVAGVDGTLRKRMKGTAAEGNVHAKTGYVSRVSCLSGYVTSKSGEPLVFSIMMNGHLCPNSEATKIQDRICAILAGSQ